MRLYSDTLPAAADLYGDIEPAPNVRWRDYLPGLMVAVLASLAGSHVAPGATVEGALTPGARRLGFTVGASYAAERSQAVGDAGARWARVVFSAGAHYRLSASARLKLDLHADGLLGLLRVAGSGLSGSDAATWSGHSDLSAQLGVGAGVRALRSWGSAAVWVGLGVLAWPGHQRLYVQGDPDATGEIPALEGRLAIGAAWGRFP